MFAILEIGGKQYKVSEGDILRIEKLETEVGKQLTHDKVLLVSGSGSPKIGTPYVAGASIELKVLSTALGEKVRTFKMKAKKRYKRLKGHRQPYSEVKVIKIKA